MKKVVLIDGNNLMFRSYYATMYSGNIMKNSKGIPTNALYGFINMINKIIQEDKPEYMLIAFDKGKTFRHAKYDFYKGGRIETPDDLKQQFKIVKELLTLMKIKWFEIDNYEADDIIGTLSSWIDKSNDYIGTIVSSDKDLLQLISDKIVVKHLKQNDCIMMNRDKFYEIYGIEPINMIDLKAIAGDSSDNIKGVNGIGEKGALKLLSEYKTVENIYDNIDSIGGKTKEKLLLGKEDAMISKELVTIYREVPLDFTLEDLKYENIVSDELIEKYKELEFFSFVKKYESNKVEEKNINLICVNDLSDISIDSDSAFLIELDNINYHFANIVGMSIYDGSKFYYVDKSLVGKVVDKYKQYFKVTYDLKKMLSILRRFNIELKDVDDIMIEAYLLNYNLKDDVAYLANQFEYNIDFNENVLHDEDKFINSSVKKCLFLYETNDKLKNKLNNENMCYLYTDLELPLTYVLEDMESTGIRVNIDTLDKMKEEFEVKIEMISDEIYDLAGTKFNISSPKQLGEVLFEKLSLPSSKKTKSGYSTNADVLAKMIDKHPIIPKIIEYRMLTKLYGTYIVGLKPYIMKDGKIHTIFNQTLTRTGRLSSSEPNLQNIPIRYEVGRLVRKCFIPEDNSIFITSDYSQIELRILAHYSGVDELKSAFINGIDIHTKTASDIFDVPIEAVTKDMRRHAKAVNFGIIYGISAFGLSEDIGISPANAKKFMNKYFEEYPGVKEYMDKVIKNAYETFTVTTLMGRRRVIDELKNTNYMIRSSGERMALNTPIQGTSADIIKKAMIEIYQKIKEKGLKSKMIIQIHDELMFNVVNEEREEIEKIVKETMENTYKLSVPLVVEIDSGNNWYELK